MARPKARQGSLDNKSDDLKDRELAFDKVMGRRIQKARQARDAEGQAAFKGTLRGPESHWQHSDKNFSQESVAMRLGFSKSWLSKIERGTRSLSVFHAHLLAEALKVDPLEFVGPLTPEETAFVNLELRETKAARAAAERRVGPLKSPRRA